MRTLNALRSPGFDGRRRRPGRLVPLLLLLAVGLLPAVGAAAQAPGSDASADRALARRVEQRFDVLPVQNGIVLTPKRALDGVRTVELTDGTVAINGEAVTGSELRSRLGADAELVLPLTYLNAADLRTLFGLAAPSGAGGSQPPPAPAAPAPAEAPAVPATPATPAAPEPPASPEPPAHRSGDIVRFGGSVTVARDQVVDGDVAVIGGSAHINGHVRGNVTVVGGTAHIGSTADVSGDVTVVGGTLDRDPDAQIGGKVSTIGIDQSFVRGRPWRHWWMWEPAMGFFPFVGFLATTMRTALLILLVCLVLLIVPRPVETVAARAAAEPVKAGLIGLACELLFLPVLILTIILLVVTIVGIPLLVLVPFALIALLLVGLLGYTAVASQVGRFIDARFGWHLTGPYAPAIIGVVAINALTIFGRLMESLGGFFSVFAIFVLLGALFEWAAWTTGFGAAVLARFGHRMGPLGFTSAPAPASGSDQPAGTAPPLQEPGA